MKKLIYFFLFVLLPSAIHAWIVKTRAETKTVSIKPANMISYDTASPTSTTSAIEWRSNEHISVMGGTCEVYRFNEVWPTSNYPWGSKCTGFFVGTVLENGNRVSRGLSIGAANRYNRIITRVMLDFCTLNVGQCSLPAIKEYLGHTAYHYYRFGDTFQGKAIIYLYLPVSIVPIVCEHEYIGTDNPFYEAYNKQAGGCFITGITVEYVESTIERPVYRTAERPTNRTTGYHVSLGKDVKRLGENDNDKSQRASLLSRKNNMLRPYYANAVASDVNADGNVNSADVTSVYNAILSGDGTISGIRYVDLGLPSGKLWATMNYGAIVPEDFGDFYSFASTAGFLSHNIASFSSKTYNDYLEYNIPDPWKIPTQADADELLYNCTSKKTYINNVYCIVLTSNINGNQLILPATAGEVNEDGYSPNAYYAQYWTGTQHPNDRHMRKTIEIYPYDSDYSIDTENSMYYYEGYYLRLVCPKQK